MNIKVVTGQNTFFAGKNLISKIDPSDFGTQNFVIVPDRFSLQAETLIMDCLNISSTFNIEVLGISRLAKRVLQSLGFVGKTLSSDQSLLLTMQAIENVKHDFKVFKKTTISFAQELEKVIQQFKSSGITVEEAMPKNCRQALKDKYMDIWLVYQEYERLLGGRLDANKLLSMFAEMIDQSQILKNTNLFVVGFDSFTEKMFSLLCSLAKSAKGVFIALAKPTNFANAYIYEDDILEKLADLCRQEGIEIEVEEAANQLSANQQSICDGLFAHNGTKAGGDHFAAICSQSLKGQVATVGKIIASYVRNGGRFKDIQIACGDLEKTHQILQRCFEQLDIPYFEDVSIKADSLILSNAIFKFLNVFQSGFSKASLEDYFSSVVTKNEKSGQILQIIKQFNVHGFAKTIKHLSPFASQDVRLFEKMLKASTNDQFCDCIVEFCQLHQQAYQDFLQMMEKNYLQQANLNEQNVKFLNQALQSIRDFRGQYECSVTQFAKTLQLLLSFNQVSAVPTYVDSVMVGDATSSYFSESKLLFVIGGENLPKTIKDDGLVTDDDIQSLDFVKKLEPSVRVLNRRNRFKLFSLLSLAKEKLFVTYSALSEDGKRLQTPEFVSGLCEIFDTKPVRANFLFRADDDGFVAGLGSRKNAINVLASRTGLDQRQLASLKDALCQDFSNLYLNREQLGCDCHKLFFPKNKTSISQIECFMSCPFKHFVRYGLRLKEQDEFGAKDIGNVCHLMAQMFVQKNMDKLGSLTDKQVEKFISQNLDQVLKTLQLEETVENLDERDYVMANLAKHCQLILCKICYEQKYSSFKPVFTEKQIEGAEISFADKSLKFSGKVDRVDKFGDYFRIIDYKTGSVSPLVKDLYYGDKIQLFLYQKAIASMLNASPSGVFYFDCKFDFSAKGSQLLKGLVSDDDVVIAASDNRLGVAEKSDLLAVATKKEGFKGTAICKTSLLSLQDYAQKLTQNALQEIEEGFASPMPDADSCKFCAYNAICLFSQKNGFRKKQSIDEQDILNALKGGHDEV